LFKHLRTGSLPPKHGIIFQSTLINAAPLAHRGKIARALAAKLAIAAKADFYTGNFIAPKLKQDLDKRLAQIRVMPEKQRQKQPQRQGQQQGREKKWFKKR
ncbi:C/D box methylation guide ribonucleoprotein complex aNOP56 subunit, partial [Candidatus Micrarchaeota archaeon]|nr:C/D box methylation guide ribonucleoprotein complex aNOP56 subunit [Candidatus Micrarchaeota archaeon]